MTRQADFIESATDQDAWSYAAVRSVAALGLPEILFGRRLSILQGDSHRLWVRWFAESVYDPRMVNTNDVPYARLFEEVYRTIQDRFSNFDMTVPEKRLLAKATARAVNASAKAMASDRTRVPVSQERRQMLVELADGEPRCWICGRAFGSEVVEAFLNGARQRATLPVFVDILKPSGLIERDLLIEVDHVRAVANGGMSDASNLKIACGWCNRHKSCLESIYDVAGRPREAGRNSLGFTSLPQPFWVVRHLGLAGSCEHADGCTSNVSNSELTVVNVHPSGAMNPLNLRATCPVHDTLQSKRLQPPSVARSLWIG